MVVIIRTWALVCGDTHTLIMPDRAVRWTVASPIAYAVTTRRQVAAGWITGAFPVYTTSGTLWITHTRNRCADVVVRETTVFVS